MNKNHNKPKNAQKPAVQSTTSKEAKLPFGLCKLRTARWLTYGLGFVALYLFLAWGYGDVLARAEQDSYISTSTDTMYYLLSQPMGHWYWLLRWPLLLFKWAWVGGLLLAGVYTLTARFTDVAFRLPHKWEGVGFLVPLAQIGWMIYRGTNLYYKHEPSQFLAISIYALAATAVMAGISWLITRKKKVALPERVRPIGLCIALLLTALTTGAARYFNQNEILLARLQLQEQQQDWEAMIETARSARQPSRAVAAYHAVALEETDQLLDGMFELVYEYPKARLDTIDGNEEYGLFLADCNYHAGLLNAGYRCAMDQNVMNGPRLYNFKRMAVCALLMGEKELCQKYLTIISQMPFEGDFVDKYTAMLRNSKLIDEDAELKHVLSLAPKEDYFEQNYMSPLFLGYNTGLNQGTDATLITSAAACLYQKDLKAFYLRAQILGQKGFNFPMSMQEALSILAIKHPELHIMEQFPQIGQFVPGNVNSFLIDAKPFAKDRLALRHELRKAWLGTYMYYYYTENNDPDQVRKEEKKNTEVN